MKDYLTVRVYMSAMRLFYLCIGLTIPCLVVHQIGRDLNSGQEASWQDCIIFIMPIFLVAFGTKLKEHPLTLYAYIIVWAVYSLF